MRLTTSVQILLRARQGGWYTPLRIQHSRRPFEKSSTFLACEKACADVPRGQRVCMRVRAGSARIDVRVRITCAAILGNPRRGVDFRSQPLLRTQYVSYVRRPPPQRFIIFLMGGLYEGALE